MCRPVPLSRPSAVRVSSSSVRFYSVFLLLHPLQTLLAFLRPRTSYSHRGWTAPATSQAGPEQREYRFTLHNHNRHVISFTFHSLHSQLMNECDKQSFIYSITLTQNTPGWHPLRHTALRQKGGFQQEILTYHNNLQWKKWNEMRSSNLTNGEPCEPQRRFRLQQLVHAGKEHVVHPSVNVHFYFVPWHLPLPLTFIESEAGVTVMMCSLLGSLPILPNSTKENAKEFQMFQWWYEQNRSNIK